MNIFEILGLFYGTAIMIYSLLSLVDGRIIRVKMIDLIPIFGLVWFIFSYLEGER